MAVCRKNCDDNLITEYYEEGTRYVCTCREQRRTYVSRDAGPGWEISRRLSWAGLVVSMMAAWMQRLYGVLVQVRSDYYCCVRMFDLGVLVSICFWAFPADRLGGGEGRMDSRRNLITGGESGTGCVRLSWHVAGHCTRYVGR